MKTTNKWSLGILAATLLWAGAAVASTAPDFNLPDPQGRRVNLKALLKRGPVLIDFWATWCKPCIKAMPKLMALHRKYGNRGLTVLGINEDGPRSQAKVGPFLRARGIEFPVAIDGDGGVMRRMQVTALPTALLIAPDGEIVLRRVGTSHEKDLIEAIEALLPKPEAAAGGDSDETGSAP